MPSGTEKKVAPRQGHDVEEGDYVWCGEEDVGLWVGVGLGGGEGRRVGCWGRGWVVWLVEGCYSAKGTLGFAVVAQRWG